MSTTLTKKDWVSLWLFTTGMLSVIEGEDREDMYLSHKGMSRAVGMKKQEG